MANINLVINEKKYQAKELDFNFLCALGEVGIEIQDIGKKFFPAIRCYAAYCMGVDSEIAGNEINEHIIKGGSFNDVIEVFNQKAEESDFFRALGQTNSETETTEPQKKSPKKEKEVSE